MTRRVYDFDNTIYRGDSTADFCGYCLLRHPRALPHLVAGGALFIGVWLGRVDKTRAKQRLYRFLPLLADPQKTVDAFWVGHRKNLKDWYLRQRADTDVIISASPEFLLAPVCNELGVTMLASRVDARTGAYTGQNCAGWEKVRRLGEAIPDCQIEAFYSDSRSDAPLAGLAEEAFLVKGDRLLPWPWPRQAGEAGK